MTKVFPKSRICVIDIYPAIENGLKSAMAFMNANNIKSNSSDGKNLLLAYCIKSIQQAHKTTNSQFPIAFCIGKKSIPARLTFFMENYLQKVLDNMPVPYCGKYELNSPDLEYAARACIEEFKPKRKFEELQTLLKIRKVA